MSCAGRAAVVHDARCKRCGAEARVTRVRYVDGPARHEAVQRIDGACTRCGRAGEVDAWYAWCSEQESA